MIDQNLKMNRTAIIVLIACILLVAAGLFMAMKSCSDSASPTGLHHAPTPKHFPGLETVELPLSISEQVKEYAGFTISFNKENHTPNYVAWELLGDETTGDKGRHDKFWTDTEIEGCPSTSDYTRSGFDRGHMCPSADQKWSSQAMEDCFVMANICPQQHALNNGAWKTLETKERIWASRDSAVIIVAGPIYSHEDKETIGKTKVRVPGAFFKAFLAPYLPEPRAIAFVYPNMVSPGNMQDYAMSIDQLEKLTGFDFFPSLPDSIENKVEAVYSFKEWNRSPASSTPKQ